jgi:hypothetical protein
MKVGSTGKGTFEIKYGTTFPYVGEERTLSTKYGVFAVEFIWIGKPEWTPRHTVLIPTRFKIINVIEMSTKGRAELSGFEIIK